MLSYHFYYLIDTCHFSWLLISCTMSWSFFSNSCLSLLSAPLINRLLSYEQIFWCFVERVTKKVFVHFCLQDCSNGNKSNSLLHIQTLRNFPIKKLHGEVVIVRFDSALLLKGAEINDSLACKAFSTIRYLHDAGAKIILVGNWGHTSDSLSLSTKSLAGGLHSPNKLGFLFS